ncbi:MAG: metal ABC transporter permease [Desulfobacteraceae bacterium]|nr:metal ABC transporter permease [Desulfobacteraceae bacterium]
MLESIKLFIHLFPHAIAAGLVISATCTLIGVFTILKRMVFIGITLSEVAACGIAAAMVCEIHPFAGAITLTLAAVAVLSYPFETNRIPRDAVLGVIFVFTSALGILLVSKSGFGLNEVKALLYGNLILTSPGDLQVILSILLPVLVYLLAFIRPTLYTFLDREAAKLLGVRVALWELLYFFALGLAVSAASKVAGAILIFCYLVVAPSAALLLVRQFVWVMVIALSGGLISTLIGLYGSFRCDFPTNQTIAITTCLWFGVALGLSVIRRIQSRLLANVMSGHEQSRKKGVAPRNA